LVFAVSVVAAAVIMNGRDLDEGEFGVVLCCGKHILDLTIKVALFDDVVDVLDKRTENSHDRVTGIPVGDDVIHVAGGLTSSADLAVDVAALQLKNDGFAGGVCAVKDEGDHSTVYNPPINADIVVLLDFIDCGVIDFIFCVRHIRGVATQRISENGVKRKRARVGEGLEDLGKQDVLISEKLEGSFIKGDLVLKKEVEPQIVAEGPGP
jgi:hypothetical protein